MSDETNTADPQWVEIFKDHNNQETFAAEAKGIQGHEYRIVSESMFGVSNHWDLGFQNGPVKDVGLNGITNEAVLAVLIHRMKYLNEKMSCLEYRAVIRMLEECIFLLLKRTRDRLKRGVEGTEKD